MIDEEIMTVKQLAAYLKMSYYAIYRKAQRHEIPGSRIGRSWRFQKSVINRWLSEELAVRKVKEPPSPAADKSESKE